MKHIHHFINMQIMPDILILGFIFGIKGDNEGQILKHTSMYSSKDINAGLNKYRGHQMHSIHLSIRILIHCA